MDGKDELYAAVKDCDSWSTSTEDLGADKKHGRFGVTVFFDNVEDAGKLLFALDTVNLE